jgi:ribonucleoside-diphosphate reductase alpha chain
MKPKTKIFFDFLDYKTRYRENIGIEVKGGTRCVTGDTLILTKNGYKKIENLDNKTEIITYDIKNDKFILVKPQEFFKLPNSENLIRITLLNGISLTMTKEHPILIIKNDKKQWRMASDLKVDDLVFVPIGEKIELKPTIKKEMAEVIGLIDGDGTLYSFDKQNEKCYYINKFGEKVCYEYESKIRRVNFCNKDLNLIKFVKETIEKNFSVKCSIYRDKRTDVYILTSKNKKVFNFFKGFGIIIGHDKSKKNIIPEKIWELNINNQKDFLRGVFTADGYVSNRFREIELSSGSRRFLTEVSVMLLEMGITSKIRERKDSFKRIFWSLSIKGRKNLLNFLDIGFLLKEKNKRLEKYCLPCIRDTKPEYIKNYSPIIKIESVFNPYVYDLKIPETHSFVSNGIISHNTGKSTVSQAICKYISHLTGQPFTLWHSCANEIEYLEKLKTPNLPYACAFLIDEQSLSIKERVITDCGIIRLGDLNPMEQINILSLNLKTLKKEYVSATKVNNKMKPVFRITTENGKKVEATEDHVFFVDEKGKIVEKRLKELKNGDKLICL